MAGGRDVDAARPSAGGEVARLLGERGAYAIMRLSLTGALGASDLAWVQAAPEERLAELAQIDRHAQEAEMSVGERAGSPALKCTPVPD